MSASLVMAALLVSAAVAAAGIMVPFAIAQEEEASLGEEQDSLADGIISDVLDDDENVIDEQDNTADQDAANLGTQDQGAAQEQDTVQDAAQEDFDVQVGEAVQQSQEQPPETEPPPPPPEEDTTPPVLTVPEDIVVEATSADGAVVTFEVTAQDNVDGTATLEEDEDGGATVTQDDVGGEIGIDCDPPSGTTFPIGSTTVACTATDEAGNTATESFTVTVQDTTPPTLIVPADTVSRATSPEGSQIIYLALARDNVDGGATLMADNVLSQDDDIGGEIGIDCDPPSGSVFPIGTTEVECTATDEAGNTATASFTITVQDTTLPEEEITTHYDTGWIVCNYNDNTPQQCNVPFRVTIETTSVLKVGITASPEHCSSTNYYVSVDGDEDTFGGTFIGTAGYSGIGDDSRTIPPYDLGPVESGSHTLDIWVEGIPGGCNNGFLAIWGATVTVITSEPAETP
ncbi:MAG: HYR domain-containing protein [Thermoproteota archaeon]|nr:HYR domain-containing protein [Thermoproteota archaeon]